MKNVGYEKTECSEIVCVNVFLGIGRNIEGTH